VHIFQLCFQRVHPARLAEFEKYKAEVTSKNKAKQSESAERPADEIPTGGMVKKVRQTTLILTSDRGLSPSLPQSSVDNLIMNYIIEEMRPLATVEKPAFRNMPQGINPTVKVVCRKTLSSRLTEKYDLMTTNLKQQLSGVHYVCTTADIWSVNNKSYMGMTIHYITNNNGKIGRVSAALACRRFLGSHTYDRIAELISNVHLSYGLTVDKISATVTDNASNFGKAFREFMVDMPDVFNDDFSITDDAVDVIGIGDVLTNDEPDECEAVMPHHETCFNHSLNLLATTDASTACKSDATYKRLYQAAMAKCTALWNATHRSTKASDAVRAITEKAVITSGATRWNGQYDAVTRLLEIGSKLGDVCQAADVPKYKKLELECLEEYVAIMQSVAIAIDKLQAEKESYFGTVLPTLCIIQNKLQGILLKPLKHAESLVTALLQGMEKRFWNELALKGTVANKIVAAVAHPYFKLRWVPENKKEQCREIFIQAVRRYDEAHSQRPVSNQDQSASSGADDFIQFHDTAPSEIAVSEVDKECISYLSDNSTDIDMLQRYNLIRAIFIKYNTTLPSSAAVERLFSTAGQIEVPRRNCLSDTTFEKLLLLKANKHMLND
jgi:hypothetical protein